MTMDKGTERAVLAGLCQFGFDVYIENIDFLKEDIFTETKNKLLYKCIEHIFASGIKNIDIASILSSANSLGYTVQLCQTKEDQEFIRSLYNFPIEKENVQNFIIKILKLSIIRKTQSLHGLAYKKLEELSGEEEIEEILSISEEPYSHLMNDVLNRKDEGNIDENIDEYLNLLENGEEGNIGIPTPFPIYNSVIGGGLRPGVNIIAARLKVGKSYFAKEVAMHGAMVLNIPVLWIDTEMSKEDQLPRILAGLSGVDVDLIENKRYRNNPMLKEKVREATEMLKGLKLKHKRVSGKPFNEILSLIKKWIHSDVGFDENGNVNPHLLVYDYFKMTDVKDLDKLSEHQIMGFQLAKLHDLCKEFNTPVLSFVQLNRDGITKDGTDTISQSDRIGWNAVSLCIYRRKSADEISVDGIQNGNMKMVPLEGRFMKRMDDGDYINFVFSGSKSKVKELGTKSNQSNEFIIQEGSRD